MASLCAVTALVVGGVGGFAATNSGGEAMRDAAGERLTSLNDNRARELESLTDRARRRIEHLAGDPVTRDAFRFLVAGFGALRANAVAPEGDALSSYYRDSYGSAYEARNNGLGFDPEAPLQQLSDVALALQQAYIAGNPNPLGEKHLLEHSGAGNPYDSYHKLTHPPFRRFIDTFGYYDLVLIDAEHGDIIYSVYKELDFATSLRDGPYADSGLARAVGNALQADAVAFSEIVRYRPSYDDPALFVAAPIHSLGGEVLGVVALQIPMPQLDALLTANGDWNSLGLGTSGETYLLGPNGRILTDLRQRDEHPEAFTAALAKLDLPAAEVGGIQGRQHPGGRLPEPSPGPLAALDDGGAGVAITKDVLGRSVIKAWRPIRLGASNAVLVSQQTVDEALAPLAALRQDIALSAGLVAVLASAAGGLVGWLIARRIARPVRELATAMETVARERDLTQRFDTRRSDEIGLIARALDAMLVSFRGLIGEVAATAGQVGDAARETAASSEQTHQQVGRQQEETREVAAAMTEMAASVEEVARHVQEVAGATRDASSTCDQGGEQIRDLATRIGALATQVATSSEHIAALDQDARRDDEIVSLIADIAEQTNLLALNAAIESARAGEHGRGFAVVADEVRALAGRSRSAADEVRATIERLQGATAGASTAMQEQQQQCGSCVEAAESTGASFAHISERVSRITDLTDQVAGAAEEQSQVAEDIDRRLASISGIADESSEATQRVAGASEQLSKRSQDMERAARRFRT